MVVTHEKCVIARVPAYLAGYCIAKGLFSLAIVNGLYNMRDGPLTP